MRPFNNEADTPMFEACLLEVIVPSMSNKQAYERSQWSHAYFVEGVRSALGGTEESMLFHGLLDQDRSVRVSIRSLTLASAGMTRAEHGLSMSLGWPEWGSICDSRSSRWLESHVELLLEVLCVNMVSREEFCSSISAILRETYCSGNICICLTGPLFG